MSGPSAFAPHDHATCTADAIEHAETLAQERGVRLTPVRRRTLEILLEEHRALGAYEVLEKLSLSGFGAQPPVAYRALDFLVENGMAHRIRRLNAFTACTHPGEAHAPAFFICEACETVAEAATDAVRSALEAEADRMGFRISRTSVEAVGECPACRSAA